LRGGEGQGGHGYNNDSTLWQEGGGGADDAARGHAAVLVRILDDDCDNDDEEHDQGNWGVVVHRGGRLLIFWRMSNPSQARKNLVNDIHTIKKKHSFDLCIIKATQILYLKIET
jgi:hypothetical protein